MFFVSVFRQFDQRTGRSWQGVGVQPDLVVSTVRALSVAHLEAVKGLALKATDASRKQQLSWLAPLLEVEAYGPKEVSEAVLQSYVGKYDEGRIEVGLAQGQLSFLGASGVRRPMRALAEDLFLIEDSTVPAERQARVRFIKNVAGVVTELRILVSDGRSFSRVRQR